MANSRFQRRTTDLGKPFGPFIQGLLGAVAMGSLMSGAQGDIGQAMPIAAGMGLLAALFASSTWLGRVAGYFYSGLGLIASVPTMARFVGAEDCSGYPPTGFRYAALALLILIAAVSAFASGVFRGKLPAAATGLAFYGAVEILVSGASLLADGRYPGDWIAMSLMVLGAPVLGWLVVVATDTVLAVAGVAFGMNGIYAASLGSGCAAANFSGAALIAMYCVTFLLCRSIVGRFNRHAG